MVWQIRYLAWISLLLKLLMIPVFAYLVLRFALLTFPFFPLQLTTIIAGPNASSFEELDPHYLAMMSFFSIPVGDTFQPLMRRSWALSSLCATPLILLGIFALSVIFNFLSELGKRMLRN